MAYPIKNTAVTQTQPSVVVDYGSIGVNQGGYGLTSSTGFWNGKTPNVSGYVTYVGNGNSSPTMYISTGDTQLIGLANQLIGPGTAASVVDALLSLRDATITVVNVDCPNIVTSGLTFYIDAGYTPSYPKGDIIWYDLSGFLSNQYGVLNNGPTYSGSDGGGSIVFDGFNDYVDCGNLTFPHNSAWSIQFIVETITFVNTYPGYLIKGSAALSGVLIFYTSNGMIFWKHNNNDYYITTTTFGNVYDIAITYSGSGNVMAYVNGVFSTTVGTMSSTDSTNPLYLGRGDEYSNNSQYTFLKYNRALSAAEVLQNYYAGRKRFIPTG